MQDILGDITVSITVLYDLFFGPDVRLNFNYILVFILISFVLFLKRRVQGKRFFSWLFPADIYKHTSHIVDIKLFTLNRILSGLGFFGNISIALAVMVVIKTWLGLIFTAPEITVTNSKADIIIITIFITLTGDFSTYWVHRLSHSVNLLWPFHRVHHTAEVMTPVTTYRRHPVYDLLSNYMRAFLNGIMQAILLFFFFPEIGIVAIGSVNAIYYFFNLLGSNFRHTHIALGYGYILEHIFISPSQHQVHHSLRVEHHNKNFGEIFAIWDWIFGSLYISSPEEKLEFGLADENGQLVPQLHNGLRSALIEPCITALETLTNNPEKSTEKTS
tara:strand:+ start:259371 stop:260363 length:993 start_codon:yes stop_codon:yes gene_type:complete